MLKSTVSTSELPLCGLASKQHGGEVIGSRELVYQMKIMPTRGRIKGKCISSFMLVLHSF